MARLTRFTITLFIASVRCLNRFDYNRTLNTDTNTIIFQHLPFDGIRFTQLFYAPCCTNDRRRTASHKTNPSNGYDIFISLFYAFAPRTDPRYLYSCRSPRFSTAPAKRCPPYYRSAVILRLLSSLPGWPN